ncbi:MAG: FAD-dependent oxidoreductase, partial [Burkholderiales bacterium]|nr:FAD-dependent oxidoreductase [Burkholderiales bacterium]
GRSYAVQADCVVNACGVWVDELRQMDGAATSRVVTPMVAPSQGVHVVVDRDFLVGDHALLVPKTADGRVLFAVPWLGKVILGTTDTARQDLDREPLAFKEEVDFILRESTRYLSRAPTREDIKSIWVGLRPLVRPPENEGTHTKGLSREHTVIVSPSGLVTVTGGKWTTYRSMAEDVLDKCFDAALLPRLRGGVTAQLRLVGGEGPVTVRRKISEAPGLHGYGSEQAAVLALPGAQRQLGGGLTEAMVRFAARKEYARTVEDVLARRSRLLFLDARLAVSLAEPVGAILREETGVDPHVSTFCALARRYMDMPA